MQQSAANPRVNRSMQHAHGSRNGSARRIHARNERVRRRPSPTIFAG
jgi:hypothetical protein